MRVCENGDREGNRAARGHLPSHPLPATHAPTRTPRQARGHRLGRPHNPTWVLAGRDMGSRTREVPQCRHLSSTAATGTFCSGGLRALSVPCPVLPCQVWGQCFVLGITSSCPILAPCAIHAIIIPILQISKVGLGEGRPLVGGPRDRSSEAGIRTYSKEQQLPLRTSLISMPPSAPCSGSSL